MKKAFLVTILLFIALLTYGCSSNAQNENGSKENGSKENAQNENAQIENGSNENAQIEPYVGSVTVISNQTEYEPFSNWDHGYSPEMSISGIPVNPEHVLGLEPPWSEYNVEGQVLPHVFYANDFQVNISPVSANPSFSISGSFVLYKNEYTIETTDWYGTEHEEYIFEIAVSHTDIANLENLYGYLLTAEMGEYLLSISIWWSNGAGYGSSMQYYFKIIVE